MQRGMRIARYEHVLVKQGKEQELPIDPMTEPLDTPVDQTALLGGVPESMRRSSARISQPYAWNNST